MLEHKGDGLSDDFHRTQLMSSPNSDRFQTIFSRIVEGQPAAIMRPVIPVHEAFINSQSLNLILDRLSTTLACSTQRRCIRHAIVYCVAGMIAIFTTRPEYHQ